MKTEISVALCTYNGVRYLDEQLASISCQSLLPDEIVICDDGSSDSSLEVISKFAPSAPFPVHIVRNQSRLGPARNFEKAARLCKGELIAFSDQDDVWQSNKLSRLKDIFTRDPRCGGVFTDASIIDEDSNSVNGTLWQRVRFEHPYRADLNHRWYDVLLRKNIATGATMMVRSSVLDMIFPVPDYWLHDGWIAWMLVLHSKITPVPEKLIAYRIHRKQCAGVLPLSLRERVKLSSSRTDGVVLSEQIKRYEAVLEHIRKSQPENDREWSRRIAESIAHLRFRLSLSQRGLLRLPKALSHWKDYHQYSEGFLTLARDVLLPYKIQSESE